MTRRPPAKSILNWFTPEVSPENFFIEPDFNLGQFFYTGETAARLADALDVYQRPCCLCTPRLALEWFKRGRIVRLLDYDERFQTIAGYRSFDLLKPEPVHEDFDVLIFDPIFVGAPILARAVRVVLASSAKADLFMTFPVDRERELLAAFSAYHLQRIDFPVSCCNIKPDYCNLFSLYGTRPLTGVPRISAP